MAKGKKTRGQGGEDSSSDSPEDQTWRQLDLLKSARSEESQKSEPLISPDKLRRSKTRMKGKSAAETRNLQKTRYEIGYAKPPAKSQFKPGQSGNVKGRPRKKPKPSGVPQGWDQRYKNIFLEEAYRTILIREGDKTIKIPLNHPVRQQPENSRLEYLCRNFRRLAGTIFAQISN